MSQKTLTIFNHESKSKSLIYAYSTELLIKLGLNILKDNANASFIIRNDFNTAIYSHKL